MQEPNNERDPIAGFVDEYCPELDEPGRRRAQAKLRRYIEIVTRMAERIARESEREGDDGTIEY